MSLINDALKRARDVDRKRGASPPSMSLKPVEPTESKPSPHSKWLVLAIVVVALGLSLWSFSRWAISTPPPSGNQIAGAPETPAPVVAPTQRTPIEEHPVASMDPPPEPGAIQTNDLSAADPALAPDATPELRLQSIVYRLRNPAVIINGQMLKEGESIADAKILRIERHQVTLRRQETNLVLEMPRY